MCARVCVFRVLKEQWIRAKYERQEFTEDSKKLIYEDGVFYVYYMSSNSFFGSCMLGTEFE